MGRKNFRTKDARRRNVVTYAIPEMSADYNVRLTNGSGFKTIVVTGTAVSCWNWCIRAGLEQGGDLEGYHPVEITAVTESPLTNTGWIYSAI